MKRLRALSCSLAVVGVLTCGCGGGGTGTSFHSVSASYFTQFTRAVSPNTSLILIIGSDSKASAQISDPTNVEWAGNGSITGDVISIDLQPVIAGLTGPVHLQGTVDTNTSQVNITLSGAVTQTGTAAEIGGAHLNPFGGSYEGQTTTAQLITFNIDDNGNVSGTLKNGEAASSIDGTVDWDGHIIFHATFNGASTMFTGYMFMPPSPPPITRKGTGTFGSSAFWNVSLFPPPP